VEEAKCIDFSLSSDWTSKLNFFTMNNLARERERERERKDR
jgi:hypothetical protein